MFDFDVLEISDAPPPDVSGGDVLGFQMVRLDARVTEIPRGPALTLSPETSISTTIDSMRRRRRGSAIVVRNQRPLGVVSDRDILAQACGDIDDLRAVPVSALMVPCTDPLREDETVGAALRKMCGHRQWHLPIVCARGLFVGALDIADLSLWLRDRLTLVSVEAAFT
ncbi:MAG TPA: CBS domain-containing protein [Polyangia bacterium]|jgi:CBS domain-containing protein|nr:CBS domain-containing protein [Polyangia bacterium]